MKIKTFFKVRKKFMCLWAFYEIRMCATKANNTQARKPSELPHAL